MVETVPLFKADNQKGRENTTSVHDLYTLAPDTHGTEVPTCPPVIMSCQPSQEALTLPGHFGALPGALKAP